MSKGLKDTGHGDLGDYAGDNGTELPEDWEADSPAEGQELRWAHTESDQVVWVESEQSSGSPYAIFATESYDESADVVDSGFDSADEAEVEAVKIMEEIEEFRD